MTRPKKDVVAVRDLLDEGLSIAETARRVGIARATVRDWVAKGFDEALIARTDGAGARTSVASSADMSGIFLRRRTLICSGFISGTDTLPHTPAESIGFASFRIINIRT